jgi:hypothetical protein
MSKTLEDRLQDAKLGSVRSEELSLGTPGNYPIALRNSFFVSPSSLLRSSTGHR